MSFQPEDFPILCETCLGDNPYLRMTRERFAKACKICDRPFTVYRWRPGPRARFKKTEICGTCAKLKNVCQTCILDLKYGLPVQVRDETLNTDELILNKDTLPVSHTNRNYMYEQLETQVGLGFNASNTLQLPYNNNNNNMLSHMQRRGPYYKRNLPHICSFYVRGICNRGNACPYRHIHPSQETYDESLKDQNIKDRFYGINDPVANKLLNKYSENNNKKRNRELPAPPNDTAVRTLFIGGIDWSMNEDLILNKFVEYGEICSVVLLHDKKCGFITFAQRENAENAMNALFDVLFLNKKKCELNWAKSKGNKEKEKKENEEEKISENDEISEKDKEYLVSEGILAPKLPPVPDPCVNAMNTAYVGTTSTKYKSMTTHYKEAKV